jgi:HlyD family secretion protein/adhesin transport system membrane fusion protein
MLEEARTPYLIRTTMLVICFSFIAFVGWATMTKIKEIARTTGEVTPSSHIQIIQHLEGGIVDEILVRDDDLVKKDQALLRLRGEGVQSDFRRVESKIRDIEFRKARLRSFLSGDQGLVTAMRNKYPEAESDPSLEILEGMIEAQQQEQEVLKQQLTQKQKQVHLLRKELATARKALEIAEEAFATQEELYRERLVPETTFLAAKRDINSQRGAVDSIEIKIQQALDTISEFEWRLQSSGSTAKEEALQRLGNIESELSESLELKDKLEKQIKRLTVRSPTAGIVKGLEVHTVGGVIAPGSRLMEIVPVEGELLAEIKISPNDIGHIKVGYPAIVKITSYDFSRYGAINGEVAGLSATTFTGQQGETYYKGIVTMEKNYVGNTKGKNIVLPGMIVNADIITGEKTLLTYFLKPIHKALDSSFSER